MVGSDLQLSVLAPSYVPTVWKVVNPIYGILDSILPTCQPFVFFFFLIKTA